jgi:hypothetical protein
MFRDVKTKPILDKLLKYKTTHIQHINRIQREILLKLLDKYRPRIKGLGKTFGDTADRMRSEFVKSGPIPLLIFDNEEIRKWKSMSVFCLMT